MSTSDASTVKKYLRTRASDSKLKTRGAACMAPVSTGWDGLCGATATVEREAGGVMFPLCANHAAEFDAEEPDVEQG